MLAGNGPNITAVSIRGIGLNNTSTTSQPGVAIHIDGVYQPRLLAGGLGQIDLDRVEVLRGPQGTLYGRNASAGVVNFVTAAPAREFSGSLLAGYAEYNEYHLNGVVNVPLSDNVRTRLVVDYDDRSNGFEKNSRAGGPEADKGSTFTTRLKIDADLTPNISAELSTSYLRRKGSFPYIQLSAAPSAATIASTPFLAAAQVPLEAHLFSSDQSSASDLKTYGTTLTLSAKLGFATLKSISAYSRYLYTDRYDADATNVAFTVQTDKEKATTISQEFDLTGTVSRLNWLVGAYYLHDDYTTLNQYDFPLGYPASGLAPAGRLAIQTLPYRTTTKAVFTDDTVNVTDKFRLIIGARYTEDAVDVTQLVSLNNVKLPTGVLPSLVSCNNVESDLTFRSVTARGGLQYDMSDSATSYFTVSTGFKDGGVNRSTCRNTYLPEKVTSYEGGLRFKLFNGRLTLNPTAFYYDYTDFQVSQLTGLSQLLINAPRATVKGFELESLLNLDSGFSLNANLTLLDATYGKGFFNTDTLNRAAGVQNLEGKYLNRSPKVSGSVGVQYRFDVPSFGRLTARADVYASSKVYFREFNTPGDRQAAYATLNLTLIWDSPDRKYSARLYARNVTDTDILAAVGSADSFGARFINYAPPRQVGAELSAKF